MSIDSTIVAEKNEIVIRISGRFDYSTNREFRNAYAQTPGEGAQYVIDMRATEYVDSSALGMLLVFRDFAGGDHASIEIKVLNPQVRKILEIANFGSLFNLS